MKTTVVRERFLSTLQSAGFFVSTKMNELGALRGVYIEINKSGITIKSTNINDFYMGECGGKVEEEGNALVEYKTFFEAIRSFVDTKIIISTTEKNLVIKGANGEARIPLMVADGFPRRVEHKEKKTIEKNIFSHTSLDRILFSTAMEETRPILTGVCIQYKGGQINLVGTDGFRMSRGVLDGAGVEGEKYIISSKSLGAVLKILGNNIREVSFCPEGKVVEFVGDGQKIQSRLLEGEFPPYEKVIPSSHETQLIFKKEDFSNALKTVGLFAREGSRMVVFKMEKGKLTLTSAAPGSGEGTAEITPSLFEGKDNKITFNHKYLVDVVGHLVGDEAVFEMSNSFAPGVFKNTTEDGFTHIIMPIRTQE